MTLKAKLFLRLIPIIPKNLLFFLNPFFKDKISYKNNFIKITSKIQSHYVIKERLAIYRKGLLYRGSELANSYHLDDINLEPNSLIIDIGANVGDLLLWLPEFVRYIGFEPSPLEFGILSKNISSNSKALNYAATNKDSIVKFYLASKEADSSIFEPPIYSFSIEVQGIRVDKLINERIKVLKVDAEGAEMEVLEGCINLFNQIEYISIDLGFEKGLLQESTFIPCLKLLSQNGFELIKLGKNLRCLFRNSHI
jgi:FkbM family methyltransferase